MYSRAALIEEKWEEEQARYDHVSERYHREREEARQEAIEYEWYCYYMKQVQDAGYGDDDEAYEAAWRRTIEYSNSGAVDDIIYESKRN
jgi:hypothetical protein